MQGDRDLTDADAKYAGEHPYDHAGAALSTAGDANGDGVPDVLLGGSGNDDGGNMAGAAWLVLGSSSPGDLDLENADAQFTGQTEGSCAGGTVSTAGDVNADGFDDLIVGAYSNSGGGSAAGAAYLVLGSASPSDLELASADARYEGEEVGDEAGFSVSAAGDVNRDGFGDLLVGAPQNDAGGPRAGRAYLILGTGW